jgi:hypothetical protein
MFAHEVGGAEAGGAVERWRGGQRARSNVTEGGGGVDLGGILLERDLDCGDDGADMSGGWGAGVGGEGSFVVTNTVRDNLARLGAALCRD